MKDKLIIYVSCCTFGVALYVARLCISVIPIEDTRQTTNYAIMFDFAVRRITSGPVQMAMGTGRLTANTASGPFLLYQVSTFLRCQINSRLSTSGIILSALLLVIGIAFSIGLVQDGRYLWVVFVTAGLCFIGSEIWLAPYIVLDDRIRYSGERFYNMLSFLVAGYSRIVVIALLVIGLLVGSFATSYWIAALLFIIVIVRCLMKVAFFERAQLATRTYTGVAAIGGLLFLVLGPLSTIALLIAPVMFYRVAGRRTCPQ